MGGTSANLRVMPGTEPWAAAYVHCQLQGHCAESGIQVNVEAKSLSEGGRLGIRRLGMTTLGLERIGPATVLEVERQESGFTTHRISAPASRALAIGRDGNRHPNRGEQGTCNIGKMAVDCTG